MAILGTGIDIEQIDGLKKYVSDSDWLGRVFSEDELEKLGRGPNRLRTISERFCAKEAVLKALGTGFSKGVWLVEVVIDTAPNGRPQVTLQGDALKYANSLGVIAWHLSISHCDEFVAATAIAASD